MRKIKVTLVNFIIGIQLTACLSGLITPTPIATAFETEPSVQLPTRTPSPTDTIIPTITSTPIPTVSWTPLPTIPPNEFPNQLLNLLNSNRGCKLPCWLGITPGKTTISEARQFLAQFPVDIGDINTRRSYYNGQYHNEATFGFPINNVGSLSLTVDIYSTDDLVDTVLVKLEQYTENYQIEQLLASFGMPTGIYISAQSSSPISELPPTIVILDYREQGILAWYEYPTIRIGEDLQFCFKSKRTSLELWDLDFDVQRIPIDEYINIIAGWPPKHLADVTDFTLVSFYETFINPSSDKCIRTPANLWP